MESCVLAICTIGPLGIGGQGRQPVHAPDHIDQGFLHVGVEAEGQGDIGVAGIGEALHLLDAGNALQHLFLRLQNLGFDFARGRSPPTGEDRELRPFDIGEELDRQTIEREHAHQNRDSDPNGDRGRAADAGLCEYAHRSPLALADGKSVAQFRGIWVSQCCETIVMSHANSAGRMVRFCGASGYARPRCAYREDVINSQER